MKMAPPNMPGPGAAPVLDLRDGHPSEAQASALLAMERAASWLKRSQTPEGFWKGELETNVTMDAEDILLRHFLGILDGATAEATAKRLRCGQRVDGPWATFYQGPGDLSTTIEAYVALRLAGEPPYAEHMAKAAAWVRERGGIESSRVFTRIWLAMVGRWDWGELPVIPPELVFLPPRWPLSIYSFACWARQTIVALSVICAYRPSRPLPFKVDELMSGRPPREKPLTPAGKFFSVLDKALHVYEELGERSRPKRWLRDAALKEAERWIVARQEADGSWGGIQPPMVYSTIALVLLGYSMDHPVVAAALEGLDAFVLDDEEGRRIEACQSPVWDTALALVALADSGTLPDDPVVVSARDWLLRKEISVTGDWAVQRPGLKPGGWAFEFCNAHYPDIDDTAEVVLALRRSASNPASEAACERAVAWVAGMQSRGGGWGAFDADNDSQLPNQLPFFDFGAVTDPPTEDVTAHVVEMLAAEATRGHLNADGHLSTGGPDVTAAIQKAVEWLSAQQQADGSYWGRWGVNYVYGIGAVVPALVAAGVRADDRRVAGAVRWLLEHQNPDGGWGEDLRSYVEPSWHGSGASTASQTAWALLALLAAGEEKGRPAERGAAWLVANQSAEGTWEEPWFTGTGFPWDFSINYHLYRHVFPLSALGRYVNGTGPHPANGPARSSFRVPPTEEGSG